jgi:hypothetical protein
MPDAYLRDYEVDPERLPPVCMRCGEPATNYRDKKFQWHPPWVAITILAGLLVYIILAIILTKRMIVSAPLCDRHRYHWAKRTTFILLGLLAVIVGVVVAAIVSSSPRNQDLIPIVWLGELVVFLVWLVGTIVAVVTQIGPREITDRTITLKGVCDAFIDAVDEDRAKDRGRRAARRRALDDYDDRERPRYRQDDDRYREERRDDRNDY